MLYDQVGSQGSLVCGQAPDAEIVNLTVNIIYWQDEVFSAPTFQISNIREESLKKPEKDLVHTWEIGPNRQSILGSESLNVKETRGRTEPER